MICTAHSLRRCAGAETSRRGCTTRPIRRDSPESACANFHVPGTYTYHSELFGSTGVIVIADESSH